MWAANEDPYIEYLTVHDLLCSREAVKNAHFEKIVKKLISLQTDIDASIKSLPSWINNNKELKNEKTTGLQQESLDGRRDPEYLLNYKNNIIDMKKTVVKHTRSLLKSVQTIGSLSQSDKQI